MPWVKIVAMRKKLSHNALIALQGRRAAQEGDPISHCPYEHDLKARKIWIDAYTKERNRDKTRAKN